MLNKSIIKIFKMTTDEIFEQLKPILLKVASHLKAEDIEMTTSLRYTSGIGILDKDSKRRWIPLVNRAFDVYLDEDNYTYPFRRHYESCPVSVLVEEIEKQLYAKEWRKREEEERKKRLEQQKLEAEEKARQKKEEEEREERQRKKEEEREAEIFEKLKPLLLEVKSFYLRDKDVHISTYEYLGYILGHNDRSGEIDEEEKIINAKRLTHLIYRVFDVYLSDLNSYRFRDNEFYSVGMLVQKIREDLEFEEERKRENEERMRQEKKEEERKKREEEEKARQKKEVEERKAEIFEKLKTVISDVGIAYKEEITLEASLRYDLISDQRHLDNLEEAIYEEFNVDIFGRFIYMGDMLDERFIVGAIVEDIYMELY